jgi:hypothetical protein
MGSVPMTNLGMFGITEMAMKIADAPPPAHRVFGTPSRVRTRPKSLHDRISRSKGPLF